MWWETGWGDGPGIEGWGSGVGGEACVCDDGKGGTFPLVPVCNCIVRKRCTVCICLRPSIVLPLIWEQGGLLTNLGEQINSTEYFWEANRPWRHLTEFHQGFWTAYTTNSIARYFASNLCISNHHTLQNPPIECRCFLIKWIIQIVVFEP